MKKVLFAFPAAAVLAAAIGFAATGASDNDEQPATVQTANGVDGKAGPATSEPLVLNFTKITY